MLSDSGTWDITTGLGSVALFVAAARALEAVKGKPVAVDPFAAVFCRAVGGEWAALMEGRAPDHKLTTPFGDRFVDFQAVRTRYFDDYVRAAVGAGIRQIVALAAGLDSRAYRLCWPANTTIFELDQPRVLDFKRAALADFGAAPRAARVEVSVDLRTDWSAALRDAGFAPTAPTAWIAEGLLVYLPATAQRALFEGIEALSAPGSQVAVEESTPMERAVFTAARKRCRAKRERDSYFSLVCNEQYQPAAPWFGERGWNASATALPDLLTELNRPVPEPDSEAGQMTRNIGLVRAVKRGWARAPAPRRRT